MTSLAPQFLVDDLARSMTYYRKLGFTFGEPWDGFYAIGELDGLELHLKEAPKNARRTPAPARTGAPRCRGRRGRDRSVLRAVRRERRNDSRPLTATAWGTKDFYIEDPDGYIIAFGGRPSANGASQERPALSPNESLQPAWRASDSRGTPDATGCLSTVPDTRQRVAWSARAGAMRDPGRVGPGLGTTCGTND